jgi:dipeptidyl aminopeptidase/acylaminoacyl peptidase
MLLLMCSINKLTPSILCRSAESPAVGLERRRRYTSQGTVCHSIGTETMLVAGLFMTFAISANPAADTAAKRPMTIEDLFKFPRISEPQISPDGKLVVYAVGKVDRGENKTSSNLWVAATDGSSPPRRLTTTDKKDSRPRWSPDGSKILFESNRSGSQQIWIIDVGGGEARQLTTLSTGAGTGVWSPDGKLIAFVSAVYPEFSHLPFKESDARNKQHTEEKNKNPVKAKVFKRLFFRHWDEYVEDKRQHLFVVSAEGGDPKDVTPGDRDAYPTSTTFSVGDDFCFSQDSSHLIFTAVPAKDEAWSTNFDLCRVPVTGGTTDWETLTTANGAADGAPVLSPDAKKLAYRAQRKAGYEADKWELMTVDVDPSGKFAGQPQSLTKDLDRSVESILWTKNENDLTFLAEDNAKVCAFLISDGQAPRKIDTPQIVGSMSSTTAGGGTFAFSVARMMHPPEVFTASHEGGMLTVRNISKIAQETASAFDFQEPESVTVSGAGGTPMQMWILKPPGFDAAKKWPLAFVVHGGPQGAWTDSWSNRWNPQLWAAQGYVVALPNPRGSTGFGQQYTDEISGDWGGKCYDDLKAGLAHLKGQPFIDTDRMFSAGASFGGYMMNWFQGKNSELGFKTLVTHCGVFNFDSMYSTTEELWFDEWEHGGPPWGPNRASYEKHSPHRLAANFKTPMLIIHNDLDFRVPVSEGLQLFTTLQRLGVPSKFINFPDEGHWVLKPANSAFWHREIFGWLKKYCPPGPK